MPLQPGKLVKPSVKAQFSLDSIMSINGINLPFVNTVGYIEDGDLLLFEIEKCKIEYKELQLPFTVAVLPKDYEEFDGEKWIGTRESAKSFVSVWEQIWSRLDDDDCIAISEDFEYEPGSWKNNEVYLAAKKKVDS